MRSVFVGGVQFNSIILPWRRVMSCPMSGRVSFLNFNPASVRRRGRRGWRCGGRPEHAADDFAFFPNRAVALSHFFLLWFLPRSLVLPAFPLIACGIDKITSWKNAAFTRLLAGAELYRKLTWNFSSEIIVNLQPSIYCMKMGRNTFFFIHSFGIIENCSFYASES